MAWRIFVILRQIVIVLAVLGAVALLVARETGFGVRVADAMALEAPRALIAPTAGLETGLARIGLASGAARLAQVRAYAMKDRARWAHAAQRLLDARLFPAALDAAERARILKTDSFTLALAAAYGANGQWEEAHRLADAVPGVAADVIAARAAGRLGEARHVLSTLGPVDEAEGLEAVFVRAEALLATGDREAARAHYEAVAAAADGAAPADRCVALARLERYEEALALCRARVDASPRDAEIWRALAIARETSGDDEGARKALERARALRPADPELVARHAALAGG